LYTHKYIFKKGNYMLCPILSLQSIHMINTNVIISEKVIYQ